jgi:peptidoglycan/LPS O-acetylase OafA/YrhL
MRRVLRIFPLYYAVLFALLVGSRVFVSWSSPAMIALQGRQVWLWTYLTNVHIAVHGSWVFSAEWFDLNHMWSLAVEEHFYLVWPFLVAALSSKAMTRLCVGVVLVGPVARFVAIKFFYVSPITTFVLTPFRVDTLALGGLLAYVLENRDVQMAARLRRLAPAAIAAGAALVLSVVALQRGTSQFSWPMQCIGFPGLELLFSGLIVLAWAATDGDAIHRILCSPLLLKTGKYSYGGYVFHDILRSALFEPYMAPSRFAPLPEALAIVVHAALSITLSFAVALLSWHLLEKRFLRLKRYFEYVAEPDVIPASF